ncbi:hypothetical protein ACHAWX_000232 [Stephanocyclus meneghinianus]
MVFALEQFEANKSFSVVQFATNAQLIRNLAMANETLDVLDNVRYTGGSTEFGNPIRMCQQSFASSRGDNAKSDGTFIIPVFITEYNDAYALASMSSLNSEGEVFDVTSFTSLDTLKDRLNE